MIALICEVQKYDTKELIRKTERHSEIQKTNFGNKWLPNGKGGGRDNLGICK